MGSSGFRGQVCDCPPRSGRGLYSVADEGRPQPPRHRRQGAGAKVVRALEPTEVDSQMPSMRVQLSTDGEQPRRPPSPVPDGAARVSRATEAGAPSDCCVRPSRGGRGIDESPDIDAGHALFELAPRLTRLENAVLRSVEPPLTFRQYRLLERISAGYTTVTALGRLVTITLPAISESVDVLVRKGLLDRRANEQDRRESYLRLTAAGEQALEQASGLLTETAQQILTGVPARRRPTLARDTRRVIEQVTDSLLALREGDRNQQS